MSKSLIIYYSWSGNTKVIADYIEELTGADIFEIKPVKPYSTNYSTCLNEAKNDLNTNARPELEEYLSNVDEYDTIYVGYPNWWGTIPMPILTQLEKLDLNRKIIKPFVTSGGTGMGSSKRDIEKSSKGAKVEEGLSIRSSSINSAKNTVKEWI
jgi:flavodoxin